MSSPLREKSWSVRLVEGYVLNDQVRADRCVNCKSETEILVANYNNPNLLLYGCRDNKCRHRFLRLDLTTDVAEKYLLPKEVTVTHSKGFYCQPIAPTIS